jgi:hypothetical protein
LVAVFMCHIKIQSYHIDLRCYAMRCYAMLCYIMLCYAMLCFALLCCAMLCVGVPCYALPFYACYAMLCLAVLSAMPSLQLQLHFCMFGAAWPRTILTTTTNDSQTSSNVLEIAKKVPAMSNRFKINCSGCRGPQQ